MATPADGTETLNQRRRRAVEMRLAGSSLAAIRGETGLSAPTVISAYKAFLAGGWPAVPVKGRGRRVGEGRRLLPMQERELWQAIFMSRPAQHSLTAPVWSVAAVQSLLRTRWSVDLAETTVLRHLAGWAWTPSPCARACPPAPKNSAGWTTSCRVT